MHFLNPGFLGVVSRISKTATFDRSSVARVRATRAASRPDPSVLSSVVSRAKLPPSFHLGPRSRCLRRARPRRARHLRHRPSRRAQGRCSTLRSRSKGNAARGVRSACCACAKQRVTPHWCPANVPRPLLKPSSLLETLDTAASRKATKHSCSRSGRRCSICWSRTSKAHGIDYVRLDGSTRDRAAVVERFQTDDDVSVFLVSLKAGGTGLNLTAADHVFLFDPVVESGGRRTSVRPRPPHRPRQTRFRAPPRRGRTRWKIASSSSKKKSAGSRMSATGSAPLNLSRDILLASPRVRLECELS